MKRRRQLTDDDARVERLRVAVQASERSLAQRQATLWLLEDRLRLERRRTDLALRARTEAKNALYAVQLAQIEAERIFTQSARMHVPEGAARWTWQSAATEDR